MKSNLKKMYIIVYKLSYITLLLENVQVYTLDYSPIPVFTNNDLNHK